MPDATDRQFTITMPPELVPHGEVRVLRFNIIADEKMGAGKRAIVRAYRDANASDAGRIRRVPAQISGPIGDSFLSTAQRMGIDFVKSLETRWANRITSSLAQTLVDLTGFDPMNEGAYFGTTYFGTSYFGGTIGSTSVVVFDELQGSLFAERGPVSTQILINPPELWRVVSSHAFSANILDAATWRNNGYLAMGPGMAMQRRLAAPVDGAIYEDVVASSPSETIYASAIERGSDRCWFINASITSDPVLGIVPFNFADYTFDKFDTIAAPFQVGDPDESVNGIGAFGPLTDFGAVSNIYSFTDQGKPVPLSRALETIHSLTNGSQFADPGYGWHYYISIAGLRAHNLQGDDNPVGVGERMRNFTGHNGLPTAIWATRGELWVVYLTSGGSLYGYRGTFGRETSATGQPDFYPWFHVDSANALTCDAIFSTTTPNTGTQLMSIVRADGTNLKYMYTADNGRDDIATGLTYSTDGGEAYLTTFDKDVNLLKSLRLVRTRALHMGAGDEWCIECAFDTDPDDPESGDYILVGKITADGYWTIVPVFESKPIPGLFGHTLKFRLTQHIASATAATTPPELIGELEFEYDERPEQIEEIGVSIQLETPLSQNGNWADLLTLVGSSVHGPLPIQLPDDLPPGIALSSGGGQKYAMVQSVTKRTDIKLDGVEAVQVALEVWPQAVPV